MSIRRERAAGAAGSATLLGSVSTSQAVAALGGGQRRGIVPPLRRAIRQSAVVPIPNSGMAHKQPLGRIFVEAG